MLVEYGHGKSRKLPKPINLIFLSDKLDAFTNGDIDA